MKLQETSTTRLIQVMRQSSDNLKELIEIHLLRDREGKLSDNQLKQVYEITRSPQAYRMYFFPNTTWEEANNPELEGY